MESGNIISDEKSKQKKSKVIFDNLLSDFFLIKMFDIMKKNKSLAMIKYNKKLQKRMHLNINDYKEYSELYSSIEIEIKLMNNKYGKFINILDEEKEYYHIYFDNLNEEKKRNYVEESDIVKTIKIIINYQIKSFNFVF